MRGRISGLRGGGPGRRGRSSWGRSCLWLRVASPLGLRGAAGLGSFSSGRFCSARIAGLAWSVADGERSEAAVGLVKGRDAGLAGRPSVVGRSVGLGRSSDGRVRPGGRSVRLGCGR